MKLANATNLDRKSGVAQWREENCRSLGFARDDKGEGGASMGIC